MKTKSVRLIILSVLGWLLLVLLTGLFNETGTIDSTNSGISNNNAGKDGGGVYNIDTLILPHFANQPQFIRRFEAEAHLVAQLEHPHIVPLYDYWREPDGAYLVMRWLRCGSLADTLEQGPWSPEE